MFAVWVNVNTLPYNVNETRDKHFHVTDLGLLSDQSSSVVILAYSPIDT